jgi:hypothetical protein
LVGQGYQISGLGFGIELLIQYHGDYLFLDFEKEVVEKQPTLDHAMNYSVG